VFEANFACIFNVTLRKITEIDEGGAMVDPLDPGTIALPLSFKRSRGRPRKANALSAAERARRYRARQKVLSMHVVPIGLHSQVLRERDEARAQVALLRAELEQVLRQLDR
jgi:hypothetical protein